MLYIFDMGGVVTTSAFIEDRVSELLGISRTEFEKICGVNSEDKKEDLCGLCSDGIIDTKEFWSEFSKRSGIDVKTDWFRWLFHPVRNEKTVSIINILRSEGNRVVCGTNTISAHYYNHLERGDYSFFDQTYSSCNMGVSKPDPEFWKIIMRAENVQAKDTVFIDDREDNCRAATSLGIHAIQFITAEKTAEILGVKI